MRWRLRLAEYDFQVMYKLGALNTQADALSRLKTLAETVHEDWDEIPAFMVSEAANNDNLERDIPLKLRLKQAHKQQQDQDLDAEDDDVEDILDISDDYVDEVFATDYA